MANPFGLDFNDKSIATTFATCISCFDYALTVRPNNQAMLRLSILRLRLTRWGEAVKIYCDPRFGEAEPDPDDQKDLKDAKNALVELITQFADDETEGCSTPDQPTDREGVPPLLFTILDEIACKRRVHCQHPSLLETRVLALGERTKLLVKAGSVCADELEEAFSAPQGQRKLFYEEMGVLDSVPDKTVLEVLQRAARGIDYWMSDSGGIRVQSVNYDMVLGNNLGGTDRGNMYDQGQVMHF
ncbi:hypothetical protein BKA56DRAFT_624057 [Ilyonectria sp. MPI-CAGE-AT-0026]|nr:hypothetical protein BKA56DRAFT_624057 [Ilyonectria sp. MPI-CAGE-AT-0026]